jgi:hypothetical protein
MSNIPDNPTKETDEEKSQNTATSPGPPAPVADFESATTETIQIPAQSESAGDNLPSYVEDTTASTAPIDAHPAQELPVVDPPLPASTATADLPTSPQQAPATPRNEEHVAEDGPVASLAGMFPDMDRETIEDVLAAKSGDVDAAVGYLLELSGGEPLSPVARQTAADPAEESRRVSPIAMLSLRHSC